MTRKTSRRSFGYIRILPSGRYQASYLGADERRYTVRTADGRPLTFATKQLADAQLGRVHAELQAGKWTAPVRVKPARREQPETLADFAWPWLHDRRLSETTRLLYAGTLRRQILPAFGSTPLAQITPDQVRVWYSRTLRTGKLATGQRQRDMSYSLLRTIMNSAVRQNAITENPCQVERKGDGKSVHEPEPATPAEIAAIADAMPDRYRLMVLLAAWCALRKGELIALTRGDVDAEAGVVQVRHSVAVTSAGLTVKEPKSRAGMRDVAIPPHVLPDVVEHLRERTGPGRSALLFPAQHGGWLAHSSLCRHFYPAREAAQRPDLRFHDLRHTGATYAAQAGGTIAELMRRLGHSTPGAAMRYQHASAQRDRQLADRMSAQFASETVVPITAARSSRERKRA
jgi:integrase